MNKKKIIIVGSIILLFIFISCFAVLTVLDPDIKIGYVESNVGDKLDGSFRYFNGTESKTVKFNKGDKVTINYSINIEKGNLSVLVKDQTGKDIMNKSEGEGSYCFEVTETQEYIIRAIAKKAKGKFKVTWVEE